MHYITDGYRGLGLILELNRDRLWVLFVMLSALFTGAFVGSFLG